MLINSKVLAQVISAKVQSDFSVSSFSIDSRTLNQNDCFIALIGEHHNGHNYIAGAINNGANAIIINEDYEKIVKEQFAEFKNYLVVKDTHTALVDIAKYVRSLFKKPIIGITGSVGKTTLKEMIAFVFSQNYKVGMTLGNFNNHIGLPLCVANLQDDCNLGVFEMGMSAKGEINFLGEILNPDIGIITSIGNAHAEFFQQAKDIALAKLEILDNLHQEGAFFINLDDEYVDLFYQKGNVQAIGGVNHKIEGFFKI
jgi:UDP-N-acetylmuramoyl-tripeptide--D-alanyl-D-alanine ligase